MVTNRISCVWATAYVLAKGQTVFDDNPSEDSLPLLCKIESGMPPLPISCKRASNLKSLNLCSGISISLPRETARFYNSSPCIFVWGSRSANIIIRKSIMCFSTVMRLTKSIRKVITCSIVLQLGF